MTSSHVNSDAVRDDTHTMLASLQDLSKGCEKFLSGCGNVYKLSETLETETVESLIAKLSALCCDLRSVRNDRSFINRLPPEILEHIFELLADHYTPFQSTIKSSRKLDGTLASLNLVCRYWRRVALGTHALWSSLKLSRDIVLRDADPTKVEFSHTLLERTALAPLTVRCDTKVYHSLFRGTSFFTRVMSQMHRICDLRIDHRGSLCNLPVVFADAPRLKSLAIQMYPEIDHTKPDNDPTALNAWNTPHVEQLMVEGFSGWLHSSWHNLRYLCIGHQRYWDVDLARQFISVLAGTSSTLQELVLFGVHMQPDMVQLLQGHHPNINMPRLQRIALENMNRACVLVVTSRLILPDICCQQLSVDCIMDWSDMFVRASCYAPERMYISGQTKIAVRGESAVCLRLCTLPSSELPLEAVQGLKELWLAEAFQWAQADLNTGPTAFMHMKRLRKLIFMDKLRVGWRTSFVNFCFPKLEELHFHQYRERCDLDRLLKCLLDRRGEGFTVPKLVIHTGPEHDEYAQGVRDYWRQWEKKNSVVIRLDIEIRTDERFPRNGAPMMELPDVCKRSSSAHTFWRPEWWRGGS